MHNYKELKVYQKAMDFVTNVYALTKKFPKDELFGLTNQLRRAAVSIALNIAEGAGCETAADFASSLIIRFARHTNALSLYKLQNDSAIVNRKKQMN